MGFFHENPISAAGQPSRLSDLLVQYQNSQQLRAEFQHFHGFSESSADGLHRGVAYYWARGELDVTDIIDAPDITIFHCADPLLFDNTDKAIWGIHVGVSWVAADTYRRGIFGEMYWAGTPSGASYMSWGHPPTVPTQNDAMTLTYAGSAFLAATTYAAVQTGDYLLVLDIDDPLSSVSGLDWAVRARISPYWGASQSPGKVSWDLALVRYG